MQGVMRQGVHHSNTKRAVQWCRFGYRGKGIAKTGRRFGDTVHEHVSPSVKMANQRADTEASRV
ncbi:hypothetical protein GCM10027427_35730 [Pseudoclavibacter terrae]